jgi:hypothetical protein
LSQNAGSASANWRLLAEFMLRYRAATASGSAEAARSPGCAASTDTPAAEPPVIGPGVVNDPDAEAAAAATATAESGASPEGTRSEASARPDADKPAATRTDANKSGTAATTDADTPAAATTAYAAATAAMAATAASATMAAPTATTPAACYLHAAAEVFSIEEMKCGQADVGHFLFAENEALICRGVVGVRAIDSRHRGCGCTIRQRKTQSSSA